MDLDQLQSNHVSAVVLVARDENNNAGKSLGDIVNLIDVLASSHSENRHNQSQRRTIDDDALTALEKNARIPLPYSVSYPMSSGSTWYVVLACDPNASLINVGTVMCLFRASSLLVVLRVFSTFIYSLEDLFRGPWFTFVLDTSST